MAYEDLFVLYWEQVKESAQEGRFAKLTMAKTIGKPNLRNVFLRPIYSENGFTVLLKLRYRSRDTADVENELTLEEAFDVLKSYLQKPFFSVLLFTTTKDVTFKINKKGAGSLTEYAPTFKHIRQADSDSE
jgi:hypothetical protein